MPFIAHASGKSLEEIYALPVESAIYMCGQHGVKLMSRVADLQAAGTAVEQVLCVAELLALQPLAAMFKPRSAIRNVRC